MNSYVLIHAYFAQNLGDDIFIQTLVRRYPHEHFVILESRKKLGDLVREKNVRTLTLPMRFFLKFRRMVLGDKENNDEIICKRAKAVVRIGGSIFIEKHNWQEYALKIYNTNTYILGANFGPYCSEEFLLYAINQIKLTKDCCLRDLYSYSLLSEKISNIRYAPDILFSYSNLPVNEGGNSVGISVIDFSNREDLCCEKENYINGIVNICRYYLGSKREVILFGFCKREGDEYAIDEIAEILGETSEVKKCIYMGNIEEYLQELNKCEKIYATRFHAMVIGWIMKKDVVPIIYSNKQLNVIRDIGFSGSIWDVLHHQDFHLGIFNDDNRKLSEDTIESLRLKACEHFKKLDEFLMKNN